MSEPKKNTSFRLSKERLEQLDELVIYYIEESDIDTINRTTIIDKLIKERYRQLEKEGKI